MVALIDHFEYIVVDNEAEALILECNLIKENRPKFNVLLKDDKTYPYIKIDIKSDYPGVYITRKLVNDGSKYFGPYSIFQGYCFSYIYYFVFLISHNIYTRFVWQFF